MGWTDEQRQAINVCGASVAVSAAAGSGKTTVLTERIIKHVCAPDGSGDISRILAVTFTKAAANELMSRISRALSDKLAEDPSNRHIARQSLLVSSAKISTIHRFCLDVIHENFAKLSLPSDMAVADTARLEIIKKDIMNSVIDDYFDGNIDGDDKIDDFGAFADTFGDFKSTELLSSRLIGIYDRLSSKLKFLDEIDDNIQMYKKADETNFLDSVWGKELLRYASDMMEYYSRVFESALNFTRVNTTYQKAEKTFVSDLEFIDSIAGEIRRGAKHGEIAAALGNFNPVQLSFGKGEGAEEIAEFYKNERENYKKEVKALRDTYFGCTEDEIKRVNAETAKRLSELKKVLVVFDRRFAAEKAQRRLISFSDMEHFALKILWDKENDAPTDVAVRLRDGFDEVYVDEYQDTNEIQDKIFSLISREDNEFCVGDIKQSIYGFRGAAPYIFTRMIDAREKYKDGFSGKSTKIFLSQNFRSSNEIIDFCNAVFDTLMNVGKARYGADERLFAGLKTSCGPVDIAYVQNGDAENAEADFVAKKIAELARGGRKFSDFAILLRNKTHADDFKNALEKLNIPCRNCSEQSFFESPEILLMLSMLNVIDNPARDVYLAAVLKSPIFGVTLDELMYIRRYSDGSLYDALCAFTSEKGFQKGRRFLEVIDKFRSLAQTLNCEELIWQIYIDLGMFSLAGGFDGSENFSAEQARANLIQLYNYARSFGGGAYRNLYDFIMFINGVLEGNESVDLSRFETAGDAVQITTMHDSKGLEYPVCFVSGLGGEFSNKGLTGDVITTSVGIALKTVHPSGFGKTETLHYLISQIAEKRSRREDEMRLLYVALTRAREKLILTAKPDKRSKNTTFDLSADGKNALRGKCISEYSMLKMTRFIDFLGAALAGKNKCRLSDEAEEPVPFEDEQSSKDSEMTAVEARRLVYDRLSFRYPYAGLSAVPSKMAVSQLYPDLLDDNEREAPISSFDYVPRFLSGEDESVSAAERGTATHTFMQFFDFDRVEKYGVEKEAEYLAENGFIFESDLKKIDVRGIKRFFDSDIAKSMRAAKKIWREKRFILAFDAEGFTLDEQLKEKLKGEKMLVQGVIDCAYEDGDGKIVLIDYKTDHFARGTPREEIINTLRERHMRQLTYYKKACRELFGEVSHVYVYSFALGDTVEIFTEDK